MVQKKVAEPAPSSSPSIHRPIRKNLFANVFAAPNEDEPETSMDTLLRVQKRLAAARAPKKASPGFDPKELASSTEEMTKRRAALQKEYDRLERLNLPRGCGPRCPCRV